MRRGFDRVHLDGLNLELHVNLLLPDLLERVHDESHVVQVSDWPLQLALHLVHHGVHVVHLALVLLTQRLADTVRARLHLRQQTELELL